VLHLGLRVHGNQAIFTVGQQASVVCSSDLDVNMIEWIYNYNVVVQSSSVEQLSLVFNPVNDSIHGRQYTCRVTSPYGIQEETIQVTAESKLHIFLLLIVYGSDNVSSTNCASVRAVYDNMSPPKALFGAPLFSKKQLEQDFFCPYAATGLLISVVSAIVGRGSFEVFADQTKPACPQSEDGRQCIPHCQGCCW